MTRQPDDDSSRALSEVLDQLEATAHDDSIAVGEIVEHMGRKSFAALILVFSLLSASPASAIPGLTTIVAVAVAILAVQMLAGRDCLWLPRFLAGRRLPTDRLCRAVAWLRRPVAFVERFFRPRLAFFVKRPGLYLTLAVMLAIAAFMPLMEFIPTSGSIASAAIAFLAAAILMRDGVLVLAGLAIVAAVPVAAWYALS